MTGGATNVYDAANNLILGISFGIVSLVNTNGTSTNSCVNLGTVRITGKPTGIGYFDNFFVAIPEPPGLGVLALAMIGSWYCRRLIQSRIGKDQFQKLDDQLHRLGFLAGVFFAGRLHCPPLATNQHGMLLNSEPKISQLARSL